MKIKKLGHCCLVIETKGKRIMIDPGSYSTLQIYEESIDMVVITHEHADHFHMESLKKVLSKNPNAVIITNSSVGKVLSEFEIEFQVLEDKNSGEFNGVHIEAHGNDHAWMRSGVLPPQNTGYFFDKKLFYPGDAFTNPNKPVEILALPVSAPWLKIEEVLQYAKTVNPKNAFSVHDGMLNEFGLAYVKKTVTEVLNSFGINFLVPEIGKVEEF